jgi:hypothetical protein
MSDHWISVIPKDPNFVPTPHQADAALKYLEKIAPESESITFTTDNHIEFRDCGENLESISCPFCSASLDPEWWEERMSDDRVGEGFQMHPFALPCCAGKTSLNDLIYIFDQGFSRFILDAMNPNLGELEPGQIQHLSEFLGTKLRIIYQHI